jgi:hypothetical protein
MEGNWSISKPHKTMKICLLSYRGNMYSGDEGIYLSCLNEESKWRIRRFCLSAKGAE